LTQQPKENIIPATRKGAPQGGRHQIGTPAGFGSEQVAGFRLECMAGFVGIRKRSHSIAIFAFFFRYFSRLDQTNFSRFWRTLNTGFDYWLCYSCYCWPSQSVEFAMESRGRPSACQTQENPRTP
jgi:hypothetical protein